MPTSQYDQISRILSVISLANPQSVLDIGTGFGKYGVLCREYLEMHDCGGEYGVEERYGTFTRRIDGIEAFGEYITPLHEYVYTNMYKGNALTLVDQLETTYDLVLLIDVLEHFTKSEGKILLEKLLQKSKGILISVPSVFCEQGATFGNEYETHRAHWTKRELMSLGSAFSIHSHSSTIVYLSKKENVSSLHHRFLAEQWSTGIKRFFVRIPFFLPAYRLYRYIKRRYKTTVKN